MLNTLLGLLLIIAPIDETKIPENLIESEWNNIVFVANVLELIDDREITNYFNRGYDTESKKNALETIKKRYIDLKDIPSVKTRDMKYYQNCEHISNMLSYNYEATTYFEGKRDLNLGYPEYNWFDFLRRENVKLYRFWDDMRDLNAPYTYIYIKKGAYGNILKYMKENEDKFPLFTVCVDID